MVGTPANSLNITQPGLVRFDGVSVFSGVTTTNHSILVGASSNGITSLAGLDNTVLVGHTGADPTFGTVPNAALSNSSITLSNGTNVSITGSPVSLGGTATINVSGPPSATTLTAHGVVLGQGTSAVTATAAGNAGQVLQSGGASADPTYSTPTYPSTSGTSGKILISDGTNNIYSTPTYPNAASTALKHIKSDGTNFVTTTVTYPDASVTAGKVIISDGTNYIASTPTFPNSSATSGKFIRSDGTNWIASTPTLPTSAGTSGKVLQSDGTNYVESTPTYPSASGTSRKIIVSDGTNNVYSTETWAVPGTSGNVLTSDGTNWTSAAPTSPSVIAVTTPGAYPYTTLASDYLILVDTSSARTITPMGSPTTGRIYIIKDNVGSAATNNITITPSGKNIDGAASTTVNIGYGAVTIVYNGTEWSIV